MRPLPPLAIRARTKRVGARTRLARAGFAASLKNTFVMSASNRSRSNSPSDDLGGSGGAGSSASHLHSDYRAAYEEYRERKKVRARSTTSV